MTYFNYDPYFCFQRQKAINYLKDGGLIPKGGSGWWSEAGRLAAGFLRGVKHPFKGPEKFITVVKETGEDAINALRDEIRTLKSQLSKASDPEVRKQLQELIDKNTKELNGLKVGSKEEVISNTAGTAGYRLGLIALGELIGAPAYGLIGDVASPTKKGEPSHFSQAFALTPVGAVIAGTNKRIGIDWPHAVGDTGTYDKGYVDSAGY